MDIIQFITGTITAVLAGLALYKIVPLVSGALARPMFQMRANSNSQHSVLDPNSLVISLCALFVCHLAGAFVFAMTGGALGILTDAKASKTTEELLSLNYAVSAGILTVAMVRIESIRQNLDLLDTFQQLLIGWGCAFAFVIGALGGAGFDSLVSRMRVMLVENLPSKAVFGSLAAIFVIECVVFVGARVRFFRKIPYDLARQRLDGCGTVEQVWNAQHVEQWTANRIASAIDHGAALSELSIYWLTNTHPQMILGLIHDKLWGKWQNAGDCPVKGFGKQHEDFERWLGSSSCKVRIIVPSTRERVLKVQINTSPLRRCVRIVATDEPPATRFVILSFREAIVHTSLSFPDYSDSSSNVATLVIDASRIAQMKGTFDVMWQYSRPLE